MADRGTATYYDRLTLWNRVARVAGYGGGGASLTVHRALADPRAGGTPTSTRLHDLLAEYLPAVANPDVLDAGCGLGGTMIDFAARFGGQYVGLTLSEVQASIAGKAIARAGLSGRVRVGVGSYDCPPDGPFDWVLAVESLAHSPEPGTSLAALARVLAPRGALAIVDDMPESGALGSTDLADFKAGWGCPVLWSRAEYGAAADALGLRVLVDLNLSADCRPRTLRRIRQLQWWNRIARCAVPFAGFRGVMDSHHGGLALEALARAGRVQYRLLILGART